MMKRPIGLVTRGGREWEPKIATTISKTEPLRVGEVEITDTLAASLMRTLGTMKLVDPTTGALADSVTEPFLDQSPVLKRALELKNSSDSREQEQGSAIELLFLNLVKAD